MLQAREGRQEDDPLFGHCINVRKIVTKKTDKLTAIGGGAICLFLIRENLSTLSARPELGRYCPTARI